jgi:S1-C subfamily serine protease
MILDEPVASLDPEGERAVFELFAQKAQDKVILFTTHRYDSIPKGTTIVVLVDGRIAEIGTHEELVQRQHHYWSLWTSGRDPATRNRAVHNGRRQLSWGPAGRPLRRDRTTTPGSGGINMYADAVAKIIESIFPIFYVQHENQLVGVCGTGFFVDDNGLFLTSDHVMASPPPGSTLYYYGKTPDEVCEPAVELEHVASDPSQDLFLGRVARDHLAPVVISDEPVRPGDSVCLSGYPMADLAVSPRGGLVGSVRRYWQPTFVIDANQTVIGGRLYDGYIVQHACFPGMSGAPVFDMEGKVRGLAGATLSRTIPPLPGETPTVVTNGIVIDAEHLRGFLEASPGRVNKATDHLTV